MDQENSNCGDRNDSPVLNSGLSSSNESPRESRYNDYNLESLHKDLLLHLKKQKNIPRNKLKSYLEQLSKMDPQNYKNRWLLKKVEGILKYLLKKRSDFTDCLLNGDVEIWGKSSDHSQSNSSARASPSSSQDFPMRMLTNNNFMSLDNFKMEVDNYSNPSSQDLFSSGSTQELHDFAQENYQLLKTVVGSPTMPENLTYETDDYIFKKPHPIQKGFQIHENLEDKFKSIVSLASSAENKNVIETDEYSRNIFDDLYEPGRALIEYRQMSSDVKEWVIRKFIARLPKEIKETRTSQNSATSSLPLKQDTGSVKIKPLYSEENYKIIKETCEKFKEDMKNRKQLFDFLDL